MEAYRILYDEVEKEAIELSYSLSFEEDNKNAYSMKIADLISRTCTALESCLKDIYRQSTDSPREDVKYDDNDCVSSLGEKTQKVVFAHNSRCHFDNKVFKPFRKTEMRTQMEFSNVGFTGNQNYAWNNAYQSLRHRFTEAVPHYATLKYLFESLAALYVAVANGPSSLFTTLSLSGQNQVGAWLPSRGSVFHVIDGIDQSVLD